MKSCLLWNRGHPPYTDLTPQTFCPKSHALPSLKNLGGLFSWRSLKHFARSFYASAPLRLCASAPCASAPCAPLHLCASAPLHLCASAPLRPAPCALNPAPCTLRPAPCAHPDHRRLNPSRPTQSESIQTSPRKNRQKAMVAHIVYPPPGGIHYRLFRLLGDTLESHHVFMVFMLFFILEKGGYLKGSFL